MRKAVPLGLIALLAQPSFARAADAWGWVRAVRAVHRDSARDGFARDRLVIAAAVHGASPSGRFLQLRDGAEMLDIVRARRGLTLSVGARAGVDDEGAATPASARDRGFVPLAPPPIAPIAGTLDRAGFAPMAAIGVTRRLARGLTATLEGGAVFADDRGAGAWSDRARLGSGDVAPSPMAQLGASWHF